MKGEWEERREPESGELSRLSTSALLKFFQLFLLFSASLTQGQLGLAGVFSRPALRYLRNIELQYTPSSSPTELLRPTAPCQILRSQMSTRTLLSAPRLALRLARQPTAFRLLTTDAPLASTSSLPEAIPKLLPYFIPRTASNGLPVYGEIKSGGQRFLTIVRKVDGNVEVRFSPPASLGVA